MAIGYTEIDFVNGSAPALNAANLNKIDEALKDACDLLDAETVAGRALVEAADAAAQRSALGLGDSATKNVGTGAGDVAAGNAPADAVTTHESTYAHANLPTANEKTRLSDIQAASGATTALKLANLTTAATTSQKGTALLAADGGTTAGTVVQGNDSRLGSDTNIAWTPVPQFGGVNDDGTYSVSQNRYNKLSAKVYTGECIITWTGKGTKVGAFGLAGLPVVPATVGAGIWCGGVRPVSMVGLTAGGNILMTHENQILYFSLLTTTGSAYMTDANFAANTSIRLKWTITIA